LSTYQKKNLKNKNSFLDEKNYSVAQLDYFLVVVVGGGEFNTFLFKLLDLEQICFL
jgi:hypothetical protein